jgi:hypothetical protein
MWQSTSLGPAMRSGVLIAPNLTEPQLTDHRKLSPPRSDAGPRPHGDHVDGPG